MAKCVLILILEYNELQFETHLLLVEYHKTQIKINQYNYIRLGFFSSSPITQSGIVSICYTVGSVPLAFTSVIPFSLKVKYLNIVVITIINVLSWHNSFV